MLPRHLLPTDFLTGKMSRTIKSVFICAAQDVTSGITTVANCTQTQKSNLMYLKTFVQNVWAKGRLTLLNLQLAGPTGPAVAHLLAGVFGTVE